MNDDLIFIGKTKEGKLVVSSKQVADDFNKRHANVLRDIENLISTDSKLSSLNYFIESSYTDAKGETRKEYLLTRDGFSLLVMGFTGKKALEWKLKYIDAFNRMEKEIIKLNEVVESLHEIIEKQQDQILELTNDVKRIEGCVGIRAKKVFDYTKYIKEGLGIRKADSNYKKIKQRILYEFGASRWEELTYQDEIIDRLDELIDKYKEYEQIKMEV